MSFMPHSHFNQSVVTPTLKAALATEGFFSLGFSSIKRVGSLALLGLIVVVLGLAPSMSLAKEEGIKQSLSDAGFSFEAFETELSLGQQTTQLCAWEQELGFFLSRERSQVKSEVIECTDRLKPGKGSEALGPMKDEFTSGDEELMQEIQSLTEGFPIAVMAEPIARYDREIAGLIVGIGKKESNWGKRTPKLNGEECFNFWGYRGVGTRGFTPDGYGCWDTPAEAVKTIGDRLAKLRDVRESAEPARMIVWKCGSTCAGHSDESVRKWIADVNFYYREIAQK